MHDQYWPAPGKAFGPPVEGYRGLKLRRLKSGTVKWYTDLKLNPGDKSPWRVCLDTPDGPWPGPLELAQKRYWEKVGEGRPVDTTTTMAVAFAEFLAGIENTETQKRYRTAWNMDIGPLVGKVAVSAVQREHVIRVLNGARARVSERTGERLSGSALYTVRMALTSFFTWATRFPHEYRDTNPVKLIDEGLLPQLPEPKPFDARGGGMVVTEEEIDAIAAAVAAPLTRRHSSRLLALQLELYVQVGPEVCPRISEFFGLLVDDYEKPLGVAGAGAPATLFFRYQVNRARKAKDGSTHLKDLKSSGSTSSKMRKVACSPYAQRKLDAYIALGRREGWLRNGGPLFPQENGLARNPGYVSKRLKMAVDALQFDKRVTSHIFRHTWASNALDQGHDLKFIAEVLGNSEKMVDQVYAHRVQRLEHDSRVASVGRR